MGELRKIPNVGKSTERDLIAMGYTTISGRIPRAFYEKKIYGMSVEKK